MSSIFGTDGIRHTFGTQWLTPSALYALGHATAQHLTHSYNHPIHIAIATDTRASRHTIANLLKGALSLYPFTITEYSIIPTSALVALLDRHAYTCGIMITASHNKHHDNGIKIFGPHGAKLPEQDEQRISTYAYYAYHNPDHYEQTQEDYEFATINTDGSALMQYQNFILQRCSPNLYGTRIVIDAAAGACHTIAPEIFRACGAHVIVISPEPNGYNINYWCGSTQPEQLQQAVKDYAAHAGFAFDGDGDRVIAVNCHGHIKDGDDMLAILTHHPAYQNISYIVGTHMTNMGLETMLKHQNQKLIRTRVGDKHVAAQLEKHHEKLGGEPSGHIRLTDLHTTGDGILTALRLLEVIIQTRDWSMPSFEKYTQITYTIPIYQRLPLEEHPLSTILDKHQQRIDGRIYARYSGTEPVMRLMVESKDTEEAYAVGKDTYDAITHVIGDICKQ